jgi:hypothetical protein
MIPRLRASTRHGGAGRFIFFKVVKIAAQEALSGAATFITNESMRVLNSHHEI